ncbi:hypothetical protein HY382_02290 [Candidatus Curtissbacteria bacterium]|nr:hypothetical protein [Candidatus Curtissbacteria bacterium]
MHKAQTLVIQCIDLRFQKMVDEDLEKRGLKEKFDRISWPGASLDLNNVKNSAEVSLKLHDPDEIIVYEHEDCGAYGNDNSPNRHKENALKLIKALQKTKPSLKTVTLIATFIGVKSL